MIAVLLSTLVLFTVPLMAEPIRLVSNDGAVKMVDSGEFVSIFQAERARLIAQAMARDLGD